MSDTRYSEMLSRLVQEYFYDHIDFDEYRSQRRMLLDKVDKDYNHRSIPASEQKARCGENTPEPSTDTDPTLNRDEMASLDVDSEKDESGAEQG